MRTLRVQTCPRELLNGPCGGAIGDTCDVNGKECPWVYVIDHITNSNASPLFEEHPLFRELEKLIECDSPPKASSFWRNLEKRRAFSVEFPITAVKDERDILKILGAINIPLITVPDNPLGYPHYEPIAFATYLTAFLKSLKLQTGLMPHITTKDRNLTALSSELRTTQLVGFDAVLLTTGDWPAFNLPSKPVFELDSANLIRLARLIFAGVLPTGEKFGVRNRPRVIATMNPYYPPKLEVRRVLRKLIAGAEAFFTQVVVAKKGIHRTEKVLNSIKNHGDIDVPVVISLLYPIREEIKPTLEKMGIPTGNSSFEELLEEIKACEFLNGLNLIVLSQNSEEWINSWKEVKGMIKEVFG